MSFLSDSLIERIKLKKSLILWQTFSVVVVLLSLFLFRVVDIKKIFFYGQPYIARIYISGFIDKNYERDKAIRAIANDKFAKALLVHIDSPGGTLIGGETLYNAIKEVAGSKKVAVVMGGMATSGAYMTSLAGDYIVAHNGTITGSIGVIMQSPDVSGLMKKVGIDFNIIKSGKMKGIPSMFQQLSDEGKESLRISIDDAYQYFLDLVVFERQIKDVSIIKDISTGKIYTARQALQMSLIDKIGSEEDALRWFDSNNIKAKVRDVSLYRKEKCIKKMYRLSSLLSDTLEREIFVNEFLKSIMIHDLLAVML